MMSIKNNLGYVSSEMCVSVVVSGALELLCKCIAEDKPKAM